MKNTTINRRMTMMSVTMNMKRRMNVKITRTVRNARKTTKNTNK
jgi:hypothetical protein